MSRIFNFSAGPAVLPEEVLAQAGDEMLDWHGSGMSVMEMSHRGKEFIGDRGGGGEATSASCSRSRRTTRCCSCRAARRCSSPQVPMNLLRGKARADYVYTGEWSKKAIKEAKRFCEVNVAASSEDKNFTYAPEQSNWQLDGSGLRALHLERDHRRGGVPLDPGHRGNVPLVADASSHILSRPLDVSKFGLIYAGAQKNIGPAGLVIVIVREDLLGQAAKGTPTVLDYKVQAEADSMFNTPATYAMYIAGLVFQWLKKQGGLAEIEKRNIEKAKLLYDFLDASGFFKNPVREGRPLAHEHPVHPRRRKLDDEFLKGAEERGMVQLKGHRSVGGMRASIYNAMPIEGVQRLVEYMKEFEAKHG